VRRNTGKLNIKKTKAQHKARNRKWREENVEHNKARNQKWLKENAEHRKVYKKEYRKKNQESINAYKREKYQRDMQNPYFRLKECLRNRLRKYIKRKGNTTTI